MTLQTGYHLMNILGTAVLCGGVGLVLGFAWGLETAAPAEALPSLGELPLSLGELPPLEQEVMIAA